MEEENRQFRTPSRKEGLEDQRGKSNSKKEENDNDEEDFELFGNSRSAKKLPEESSTRRSAAQKPPTPLSPPKGLSNKPWDELPVLPMDKVNTLMLSTASLEWEITVTLHQPGSPPVQSMTSRVAVKQAKLVITELRTRMRPRQPDDEVPTVSSVLVAGMRELAVLEDEDINEAISTPEMGSWEGVIEVICQTEFKTQVAYRVRGPITYAQVTALSAAVRRLKNLQKCATSAHDPVSSTLAAVVVAGLLTWDT